MVSYCATAGALSKNVTTSGLLRAVGGEQELVAHVHAAAVELVVVQKVLELAVGVLQVPGVATQRGGGHGDRVEHPDGPHVVGREVHLVAVHDAAVAVLARDVLVLGGHGNQSVPFTIRLVVHPDFVGVRRRAHQCFPPPAKPRRRAAARRTGRPRGTGRTRRRAGGRNGGTEWRAPNCCHSRR